MPFNCALPMPFAKAVQAFRRQDGAHNPVGHGPGRALASDRRDEEMASFPRFYTGCTVLCGLRCPIVGEVAHGCEVALDFSPRVQAAPRRRVAALPDAFAPDAVTVVFPPRRRSCPRLFRSASMRSTTFAGTAPTSRAATANVRF